MKHLDIAFGFSAAIGTGILAYAGSIFAVATGAATFAIMALRLRKEWRHRND